MAFIELIFLAISLSMDAFAVSLSKGLCMPKINYRHAAIIAFAFGGFQALNPLVGWLIGKQFERYVTRFDHWIAFGLLALIGIKMIVEALKKVKQESECQYRLDFKELLVLSVATSIDALAVGITFSFLQVMIIPSVSVIGMTTFIICFAGVIIGNKFGSRIKKQAEIAGGIVLILIGLKIFLEHQLQ
jgi:manganese efflux pump family protein